MLIYGSLTKLPKTPQMINLRKFHSWCFLTNLKLPPNSTASKCLNSSTPYQFSSSFWRSFSFSAQFHKESSSSAKKPLGVFFQEAVGLIEKSEVSESEDETENKELKCKLRKLEEEVRVLREKRKNEKDIRKEEAKNGDGVLENEGKSKKLHELFMDKEVKSVKSRKATPLSMEDHTVYKELSPDIVMFVTHLYNEGYFKDSKFLPRRKFDITCFENSYARDFVKYAAEQFGRDHREIAKWLSGSDLKKSPFLVALLLQRRLFFLLRGCAHISEFKKIMYVSDPLNVLRFWRTGHKYINIFGGFEEFEFTVTFLKNGFLVDLVVGEAGRVLKLDSLSRSEQWKGVDFLIFNSYHWWIHTGRQQTWDYFEVGDKLYKEMDHMKAYKIALTTWANWIDSNVDPSVTKVFFQGISVVHYHGKDWDEPEVKDCSGQTKPIQGSTYPGERYPGEEVVKSVLSNMTKPVDLLDVTLLTQLRKDGHPSRFFSGASMDCSHWCVAGVPDAWNVILYTILLEK